MVNEPKIRKLRSPETGSRAVLKNRDWESKNVDFCFAREESKQMVNELKIRNLRSPETGSRAVLKNRDRKSKNVDFLFCARKV